MKFNNLKHKVGSQQHNSSNSITQCESDVIYALRLPLMIMVVISHAILIDRPDMPETMWIENLFSRYIPIVAVPLFMFISGFLFFCKMDKFNIHFYGSQLCKRVKTLFVPYLLWNTIVIIFFFAMHKFAPALINDNFENVANFSVTQLIDCYWSGSGGFPIAYQFWFIRDLIIINLFTPLVYLITKAGKYLIIFLLLINVIFNIYHFQITFYYICGAYFALKRIDFVRFAIQVRPYVSSIALFAIILLTCGIEYEYIKKIYILCGTLTILSLPIFRKREISHILRQHSSSSFFLYASHAIIALITCKALASIVSSENPNIWTMLYFANISFIITLCILLYKILHKFIPIPLSVLTGGH